MPTHPKRASRSHGASLPRWVQRPLLPMDHRRSPRHEQELFLIRTAGEPAFWEPNWEPTATVPRRHQATVSPLSESSWSNPDDRLPFAPVGRVEGGDGVLERRDVADVRPQPSVPHPLHDLTQLGAIGLDDEVDR
jgi:hypothetical protein